MRDELIKLNEIVEKLDGELFKLVELMDEKTNYRFDFKESLNY